MKLVLALTLILPFVACSTGPVANVTREEAIELLNAGRVSAIGVSHSGWTSLSLDDGEIRQNKAEVIGYPDSLLAECADCSNVAQWIE